VSFRGKEGEGNDLNSSTDCLPERDKDSVKATIPVPSKPGSALNSTPAKEPDVVRIYRDETGQLKIDITEVISPPGQNEPGLLSRIRAAFQRMPESLVGKAEAIPPK
jgi:hypothetical protein